jgi:hypothetical protein
VIQIKTEATGKRAALLIQLQAVREKINRLQLQADQIVIRLLEEDYDGDELFKQQDQSSKEP